MSECSWAGKVERNNDGPLSSPTVLQIVIVREKKIHSLNLQGNMI